MIWGNLKRVIGMAMLLLVTALMPFAAALANGPSDGQSDIHSRCWAQALLSDDPVKIAAYEGRWDCSEQGYSLEGERTLLRFDIKADDALPLYFFSRRTALERVHLVAIDADGAVRRSTVSANNIDNAKAGGFFRIPLPQVTKATRQVIAAIDMPSHRMTLEQAYLAPADIAMGLDSERSLLLLAILCGTLVMPVMFNLAFYRVLREPFVLWHCMLATSLLLTVIFSSGLAPHLTNLPAMTISWVDTLIFGATVASGIMFTYSFVEPDKLSPRLRRALPYCAGAAIMLSSLHVLFPYVARPVQSAWYTAAFAPIIIIFVCAMLDATLRGSRAAKYQAIGYAPMIVVGLIRLVSGVFPMFESNDAMWLFYPGCVFEVLLTTMGVADRFMQIKRQRDHARTEANLLERLSESDPLTGLLNRRALEAKFQDYQRDGFNVLAVLDLDHFKAVNDVYGHQVGDDVLQATAEALRADANIRAFRIGGEEFVLLLRGEEAVTQAERRRQSIPAIVARAVPHLGAPVTASMGVTTMVVRDGGYDDLSDLYQQADVMLYEAKSEGRNRTKIDAGRAVISDPMKMTDLVAA